MSIQRSGSVPSTTGPAASFTGKVRMDPLFQATAPARVSGIEVTFEPGARTAWHAHPLGQKLLVTSGRGHVQFWSEARQDICPGDVVTIPPGTKHWHGASATTAMSHTAIQEELEGIAVEWMELVSDSQYASGT
ncbi:MAG: cupin domain-containing protein [Gammaproteobacteria bacterium]